MELPRTLTFWDVFAIALGQIIGSGIMVLVGIAMGVSLILIKVRSPMLFSVGMYLPLETTFAIFVGGVVPAQDYDVLMQAGVKGIYGPGTPIPVSAKHVLEQIKASLT